jgi:UDP-N-acetylglucosamine acyltransferase
MGSSVNKDVPAYVKVRGNPAKPFGINVTGIKRAGYSKESIEALRSAYRTIYRKKLTVDEALKETSDLRKEFKEVNIFLTSIEKSTRGISR